MQVKSRSVRPVYEKWLERPLKTDLSKIHSSGYTQLIDTIFVSNVYVKARFDCITCVAIAGIIIIGLFIVGIKLPPLLRLFGK